MNILVCIKQVPDDFAKVHLGQDGNPAIDSISKIVNAFDTYAVEMAVRNGEANGGKTVVVTIGEETVVRPSVVQMISVGANNAYIYSTENKNSDESVVASQLAEIVKNVEEKEGLKFDLIFTGKESTDKISSQVGAMLAEKMNVGFVSNVVDLQVADNKVKVSQETDEGFNTYELTCPAVISVGKPNYEPRYPTLKSKMAARKAVIPFVSEIVAGTNKVLHEEYSEPTSRKSGVKIQEKENIDAVNKAFALLDEHKVL